MDLDQISTRAEELAASFGLEPPRIESGPVPEWVPEGLRALMKGRQPVIIVGPAFGQLSTTEQEGALAVAMVTLDHFRTGRYKPLAAVMLPVLILGLPLSYVAGAQGIPSWVPTLTIMVTGLLGSIGAYAVWGRHITYQIDHRVTEVMGRPLMDTMLDLDARKRPQMHGLARLYLTMVSPSEAQRATRLDGFLGHGRDIR